MKSAPPAKSKKMLLLSNADGQAIIFNYMSKEVGAEVTLENIGEFDFVETGAESNELKGESLFRSKTVRVPAQDGSPVSFLIRPKTLGNIDIRMTAKSFTAGDAIVRKLLVKVGQFAYFP